MSEAITIGSVTAQAGEVKRGGIPIIDDLCGRAPIIVYRRTASSPACALALQL